MNRTCIIVSPYFPPSTLAGVHRARHLAKHLPATGWTPVVVAVDEAFHEQRLDAGLAGLVPGSVEVLKVPALPSRISRPFGLGEIGLRAWWPIKKAVMRLLSTRDVDAVLITGSPYYPMLFAAEIKRRFGVPVVLDFQDPWVSAWGATAPRWSKAWLSYRLAVALEPRAVSAADFITSVSDSQNEEMTARYPWLDRSQMLAIPIGGDPEDFQRLRHDGYHDDLDLFKDDTFTLCYVGTIMPRSEQLVRVFLKAFARARCQEPQLLEKVKLLFVGTSNQPNDFATYQVLPLAKEIGVSDAVREVPQRLPYLEAISVLTKSNGIMLIGSSEPHYTASKIYPGLMAGRPFISLFHKNSSSHSILSMAGGGLVHSFENEQELASLEEILALSLIKLTRSDSILGIPNPEAYAPFHAAVIAQRFSEVFQTVTAKSVKRSVGSIR